MKILKQGLNLFCGVLMVAAFLFMMILATASAFAGEKFISSSIKNGSYTVPAGKIAVVKEMSGDFQVNGLFLVHVTSVPISVGVSAGANTGVFVVMAGDGRYYSPAFSFAGLVNGAQKQVTIQCSGGNWHALNVTASTATGFTVPAVSGRCGQGYSISVYGNIGTSMTMNSSTTVYFISSSYQFKAKSGDVLNGSYYIVELFER